MHRILLRRGLTIALCAGLLLTSVASLTHRHEARSVRTCEACLHAPMSVAVPSSSAALVAPAFSPGPLAPDDTATECDPLLSSSRSRGPPA